MSQEKAAMQPQAWSKLVRRYVQSEGSAGRLSRSFFASKTIAGQEHYFLVLDRRSPNADLGEIARKTAEAIK